MTWLRSSRLGPCNRHQTSRRTTLQACSSAHQTYDGRMDFAAVTTTTVENVLGRKPLTLPAWVANNTKAELEAGAGRQVEHAPPRLFDSDRRTTHCAYLGPPVWFLRVQRRSRWFRRVNPDVRHFHSATIRGHKCDKWSHNPAARSGPLTGARLIPFEPAACERPAGVGRPGGGVLPCGARL